VYTIQVNKNKAISAFLLLKLSDSPVKAASEDLLKIEDKAWTAFHIALSMLLDPISIDGGPLNEYRR
jgi:hypothetical protein